MALKNKLAFFPVGQSIRISSEGATIVYIDMDRDDIPALLDCIVGTYGTSLLSDAIAILRSKGVDAGSPPSYGPSPLLAAHKAFDITEVLAAAVGKCFGLPADQLPVVTEAKPSNFASGFKAMDDSITQGIAAATNPVQDKKEETWHDRPPLL